MTAAPPLDLAFSLADQSFDGTKSVGIFNVSLQLLRELTRRPEAVRLTVLANHPLAAVLDLPESVRMTHYDWPVRSRLGRMWWDQFGAYRAAHRTGAQWLLLPKGFASFARRSPVKLAVYVHDVMQQFYDRHYPGALPALESAYFRRAFQATLRNASVIFTNSEHTRQEVLRFARERSLSPPPVITAGIGFPAGPAAQSERANAIMVLTGKYPHKRTDLAVQYLDRWQRQNDFPGEVHWVGGLPPGLVLAPHPRWRRHARLSDTDYTALLGRSRALVYFSANEGFGMPPVEALLAGTCPVFSLLPATREVMGPCGCGFENESYDSFARALNRALGVSAAETETWATELRARHDWRRVADRVVQGLVDVSGSAA